MDTQVLQQGSRDMFTYVHMYTYRANRKPFRDTELCYQLLLDCQNIVALWKVPRLRPFVPLVVAACRRRRVRNIGGMIVTGKKMKYLEKNTCPVPQCPPQISHGENWDRTLASAVEDRRLTA